ncbi:MAG: 50S ribosomal protein L11 methyltransferase, partial [Lachnospiraceae bacterium]|nr:50S ribosomal protein L11 methyltransferase [Lachnospiraceae bacterium]
DADWKDNWKQFFHKFYIDDILVLPSWEEDESAGTGTMTHFSPDDEQPSTSAEKRVIVPVPHDSSQPAPAYTLRIDPGTAFGTGAHETTQLCIRALRRYLKQNDRVLDVGTGSGVLSILALMFGASRAVGTDLDPQVIPAVAENLARNNIESSRFQLVMGNLIDDVSVQEEVLRQAEKEPGAQGFDLVLANILPAVLVPLTPVIPRFLKKGGTCIMSGILTERIPEVKDAIEHAGLTIIETSTQGEWNAIVSRLNS